MVPTVPHGTDPKHFNLSVEEVTTPPIKSMGAFFSWSFFTAANKAGQVKTAYLCSW